MGTTAAKQAGTRLAVLDAATEGRVNAIGDYILRTEPITYHFQNSDGKFKQAALFDYALNDWAKSLEQGEEIDPETLRVWGEEYANKVYALRQADKEARGYGIFMKPPAQAKVALLHEYLSNLNAKHGVLPGHFLTAARGMSWRFMFWIIFKRMGEKIAGLS